MGSSAIRSDTSSVKSKKMDFANAKIETFNIPKSALWEGAFGIKQMVGPW